MFDTDHDTVIDNLLRCLRCLVQHRSSNVIGISVGGCAHRTENRSQNSWNRRLSSVWPSVCQLDLRMIPRARADFYLHHASSVPRMNRSSYMTGTRAPWLCVGDTIRFFWGRSKIVVYFTTIRFDALLLRFVLRVTDILINDCKKEFLTKSIRSCARAYT